MQEVLLLVLARRFQAVASACAYETARVADVVATEPPALPQRDSPYDAAA